MYTHGVSVVVGNGHGYQSSNPGWGMNPIISLPANRADWAL